MSTAVLQTTVPDKLADWTSARLAEGMLVGTVGSARRFRPLHPDSAVVTSFDPLRSYNVPADALAAVLAAPFGLERDDHWVQLLEMLVRGLQMSQRFGLYDLPQLLRNDSFRVFVANDIADRRIQFAWRKNRAPLTQRTIMADGLERLLREMPTIAKSRVPLPAVPLVCFETEPRRDGAALAAAIFTVAFAARRSGERDLALALELPAHDRRRGDDALARALQRFSGHGRICVNGEIGSHMALRWQEWSARRLHGPARKVVAETSKTLYERATSQEAITRAWPEIARRGSVIGSDGISPAAFGRDLYAQIFYLTTELRERRYAPMPLQRLVVKKANGTNRALGIPTVRDRLLQHAMAETLTPIFERHFLDCSYAYRPGRNAHHAIAAVERARDEGFRYAVNADIRQCFDSLDHDLLFDLVDASVQDNDLVHLIRKCVRTPVAVGRDVMPPPRRGVPQGAPISPLLANLYLHLLDRLMMEHGFPYVRYADDFIALARSPEEAREVAGVIRDAVRGKLLLDLKVAPKDVVSFVDGFKFLGYVLRDGYKHIEHARIEKLKGRVRRRLAEDAGPAKRLRRVNNALNGFGAYYATKEPVIVRQLASFDGWCREEVAKTLGSDFVAQLWSVNRAARAPRDYYVDLSAEDELEEMKQQTEELQFEVLAPDEESSGTRPVAASRVAPMATTASVQAVAAPAAQEVRQEPLRTLFEQEEASTTELREFLALARDDAQPATTNDGTLAITTHGASLSIHSNQIVVRKAGSEIARIGLITIKQLIVQAIGVTLSSTLLRGIAEAGIAVHFLDWKGRPYGEFASMSKASPNLLRNQVATAASERSVQIATAMLHAKASNQLSVLRLYTRYRITKDPKCAETIERELASTGRDLIMLKQITGPSIDAARGRILAVEGRLAAAYFRAVAALVGDRSDFAARERQRPDRDDVNTLLDYTYGMLYTRCHRALVQAGLDPRLGFVHTDRRGGKLSLVYDFVEEFRGVAADRVVLALISRGVRLRRTKQDALTLPARRTIRQAFERNLTNRCRYRTERLPLADIIDAQAKHLAEILMSEKPYRAFRYNH